MTGVRDTIGCHAQLGSNRHCGEGSPEKRGHEETGIHDRPRMPN